MAQHSSIWVLDCCTDRSCSGILGNQLHADTGGAIQTRTPVMSFLSTHLRSSLLPIFSSSSFVSLVLSTLQSVLVTLTLLDHPSVNQVKQEGDLLYTRRLVLKTNSLPSWGKHFFSDAKVAVIEECVVDRTKPSLTWYTRWPLLFLKTEFMCFLSAFSPVPGTLVSLLSWPLWRE